LIWRFVFDFAPAFEAGMLLGGAALERCDNWLLFVAGFSR